MHDPASATLTHLKLFNALWAIAILFQLVSVGWFANNLRISPPNPQALLELGLMLSAFALLYHPDSRRWIAATALLQLADTFISLPHMPNHRMVTSGISFGWLWAILLSKNAEEGFRTFAPALRSGTIVIYFFATLHKVNSSFLSPDFSCSTAFYPHLQLTLPFLPAPKALLASFPFMTILTEASIAICLCLRRTRSFGILLAVYFHSVLALDIEKHFFDFSSTMICLLSLFLSEQQLGALFRRANDGLSQHVRLVFTLVYLTSFSAALMFMHTDAGFRAFFVGRQMLWWCLDAIILLAVTSAVLRSWSRPGEPDLFRLPRQAMSVIPLLFLLNGFTPYFGIKTRSSFDMYSNLRVEAGRENHLLFNRCMDLLGNVSDVVRILRTSDDYLRKEYIEPKYDITFFELRRYVETRPNISLRYERNRQVYEFAHASEDPALQVPIPWWEKKLLWYRPVDTGREALCQW